jgi:hypothetical protein
MRRSWLPPAGVCCVAVLTLVARPAFAEDHAESDGEDTVAKTVPSSYFPKGMFVATITAGYYTDVESPNERVNPYSLGVSYYVVENHGLGVEVSGLVLDAKEGFDDAGAAGLNLTLRHHIYNRGDFSLFLEVALGMIYADDEFPPGGTRFNFTEQVGAGVSYRLRDDLFLIGGARFMHISNAYIHGADQNPGINALGGYIGLMYRF